MVEINCVKIGELTSVSMKIKETGNYRSSK
jgi:hypothetical protein